MASPHADSPGGITSLPTYAAPLAILLTALGVWFGTGLQPLWWLTWFAPLPAFVYATRARPWAAALITGLGLLLGNFTQWSYLTASIQMPVATAFTTLLLPSIAFAVTGLLLSVTARRSWLAAMLAVPAYWVLAEFAVARLSPNATFGSLAYSQMDFLQVIQIAAVCGISGITFVLLLLPATLAVMLAPGMTTRTRRKPALLATTILLAVFLYGTLRLATPPSGATIPVGFVVFDDAPPRPAASSAAGQRVLDFYADAMIALASAGAKIGMTPETVIATNDAEFAALAQRFTALAQAHGIDILVGVERIGAGIEHNASYLFPASGGPPQEYFKRHLVPVFEQRYTPGTDTRLVGSASAPIGLTVCKDMDFPLLSRDYGKQGTALVLAPAWDFDRDSWLHDRMAVLRGVESGFALARAARDGRISASDNRGRIIAELDTVDVPSTRLIAQLPLQHADTFYLQFGDWLAWLCLAFLGLLAMLALRSRLRRTR